MDATLTDEELLLAETAGRLAADLSATPGDPTGLDPDRAWAALGDSGLVAMRAHPGPDGASVMDAALVAEAFGRVASPVPLVGPMLAVELLRATRATRAGEAGEALDRVVAGELRATVAVGAGLGDVADLSHLVGGSPALAFDAFGAAAAVAVQRRGGQVVPVLATVGRADERSADLSRVLAEVGGPVRAVGPAVDDARLEAWRAFGLVLICADMVGAMAGALAMAVDYAKERRQFGRPIGSFQAIQHLCAEQHVSVEAARSATYYAAWAVDGLAADGVAGDGPDGDGPDPRSGALAARVAKAYVARVSRPVAEAVLQVYGGIGQTWECDAHRFLRRLLADRALLGDEHQLEQDLAGRLLTGDAAPLLGQS